MHEELWQKFESLDQLSAFQRAKCVPLKDMDNYTITMLNKSYMIDFQKRKIFSVWTTPNYVEAGFLQQLCILAYIVHSHDILPTHRLVKAESLPGGQFFFRGHHALPTDKLEEIFGKNPEDLYRASQSLGGQKRDFGDASVELLVLPQVPVTFVIWGVDEDFDARASILFDSTVSEQLPLDALQVAVHLAVEAIAKQDTKSL